MDAAGSRSLTWAGRRLVAASLVLAAVSAGYYAADQVAFTYRELDGYLPLLPIVRLGLAIVAGGLLMSIVYPIRVLAVRLPLALRRGAGEGGAGAPVQCGDLTSTGDEGKRPGRRSLHVERALDAALSLLALAGAYLLINRALTQALVPLTGGDLAEKAFIAACLLAAAALASWLAWEVWRLIASVRTRSPGRGVTGR